MKDVSECSLPARLFDPGNVAFERLFAETDATEVEITHKTTWATTLEATAYRARRELRRTICLYDH